MVNQIKRIMKKLSIKEKAKRYDKVLEQIKECTPDENGFVTIYPNEIFLELKESEDERIRKSLLEYLHTLPNHYAHNGVCVPEWIALLEKQGEQKSFAKYKVGDTIYYNSFGKLVSFVIANIIEDGTDNPMYEDKDGNSVFQNDIVERKPTNKQFTPEQANVLDKHIDKFLEQNHTDNVEPKFKNGQWIVWEDKCYKVNDNGAETKELKKIEQPHAWSEEDKTKIKNIIAFLEEPALCCMECNRDIVQENVDWLKSIKDRIQPQPKQDWSDEDERMYRGLHNLIYSTPYCDSRKELSDWLKSIKDKVQPKQEMHKID